VLSPPLTERLGIDPAVILSGMSWISKAEELLENLSKHSSPGGG